MLNFYQCLDQDMEQKILLIALNGLDFPPALGEAFEINGIEYNIVFIKHRLSTTNMRQELDYYLMKPEQMIDVEVFYQEDDDNRRF